MSAATMVPAKCPECGRLTADNLRHCKPDDKPGHAIFWATKCLTMVCSCGVTYAAHGHYPRRAAS